MCSIFEIVNIVSAAIKELGLIFMNEFIMHFQDSRDRCSKVPLGRSRCFSARDMGHDVDAGTFRKYRMSGLSACGYTRMHIFAELSQFFKSCN